MNKWLQRCLNKCRDSWKMIILNLISENIWINWFHFKTKYLISSSKKSTEIHMRTDQDILINFKFFHKESPSSIPLHILPNLIAITKSVKSQWNYLIQCFESILNIFSHYFTCLFASWTQFKWRVGEELENFSHITKQFSDPQDSTQFWHYLPRDSVRFYRSDWKLDPTGLPPIQIQSQAQADTMLLTKLQIGDPNNPFNSGCQL